MKFKIGKGSSIHLGCKFTCARNFSMGINSTINQNVFIDNRGGVFINNNVTIAHKAAIITADHMIYSKTFDGRERAVYIGNYVFVGYQAIVLGGSTLAEGSIIGAGSLANKSTEAYGIYFGLPAEKKGIRPNDISYPNSYIRLFH